MHSIYLLNMGYYIIMFLLLGNVMSPVVSGYSVLGNGNDTFVDNTSVEGTNVDNNLVDENATSVNETSVDETEAAQVYLEKYGYMDVDNSTDNKTLQTKFNEGLKEFQDMEGLNITGTLDEETKKIMHKPRCGLPDVYHNSSRTKRYVLHGSKWETQELTYKIVSRPSGCSFDLDVKMQQAFDMWSVFIPVTFNKTENVADIDIRFGPIDGSGGVLAQAYFPMSGGNILFDKAEKWTSNSYSGTNFLLVAVHEIGHSLGIEHSHVRPAVMFPTYRDGTIQFTLHQDDISAAQQLYGVQETTASPTRPTSLPDIHDIHICSNATLDAVVTTRDLSTYAFKECKIRLFNNDRQLVAGPLKIKTNDVGFNGKFDTAFVYRSNRQVYFLKDNRFWRLVRYPSIYFSRFVDNIDAGYPENIKIWGFGGVKVDAAVLWPQNWRNYFFSGDNYYRYRTTSLTFDPGYPKKTSVEWFDCDE